MQERRGYHVLGRRNVLAAIGAGVLSGACGRRCVERPTSLSGVPSIAWGVQSGSITSESGVVWSRSDRPATMIVEWALDRNFSGASARTIAGPRTSASEDFTGKVRIDGLPAGAAVHYRVRFEDERSSDAVLGTFHTAPRADEPRDVTFAWSGDVNGQGWGIERSRGLPAFRALLARSPSFYLSCGDMIYADDPIVPEVTLVDGTVWKNVTTKAKDHVAETLADFRGAHLYPRESRDMRDFSAAIPTFAIWDDHEVRNNWFPGQRIEDADTRYHEKSIDTLAGFARQAMLEHVPDLRPLGAPMYRSVRWGARVELFLVDGRGLRTRNWPLPEREGILGEAQLAWLTDALVRSTATWKIIGCNMPIGLVIAEREPDGTVAFDGYGNGNGPPAGRETELARLFSALRAKGTKNIVFLTADVHFAAAHRFDPDKAQHRDMPVIHELVAGPMHATAFGRKALDDTFGVEVEYVNAAWDTLLSPAVPSSQTFGLVHVDGASGALTVTLVDGTGRDLFVKTLRPES